MDKAGEVEKNVKSSSRSRERGKERKTNLRHRREANL